jgi:Ser/Thr protein kinase RdoA (MazF antagonist)
MTVPPLLGLLDLYPAVCRPTGAIEPLAGAGGLSGSQLYRFTSALGPLLLRKWPRDGRPRAELLRVHGWLAQARELDFVPFPIADSQGCTLPFWADDSWELTSFRPGGACLLRPPPLRVLEIASHELARFHRCLQPLTVVAPSPGLRSRLAIIQALESGGFELFAQALAQADRDRALRGLAQRWLAQARLLAPCLLPLLEPIVDQPRPLQPCLRDARPEHFLFTPFPSPDNPTLTGLVDFGAMDLESPAADLARLWLEWGVPPGAARDRACASYQAVASLDPQTRELIEPFELASALLIGERWVRWHFLEKRRFADPLAIEQGLVRALERLRSLAARLGLPAP